MDKNNAKEIAKCGLMAALTFIFTYTFKIQSPNGYVHLGDCFVFLSALILGRKNGALSAGVGAALADLLGGYMFWVLPTFLIKGLMAYIMGLFAEKIMPEVKWAYVVGAVLGGIVQIILYTVVKLPVFGMAYALTRVPGLVGQTVFGVIFTVLIVTALNRAKVLKYVREI